MIDRESRNQLASAIQLVATGRLCMDDFATLQLDWRDRGANAVHALACVLCSEYSRTRVFDGVRRRELLHWMLFLESDCEYLWPDIPFEHIRPAALHEKSIRLGQVSYRWNERLAAFVQAGDAAVWPFSTEDDYRSASDDHRPRSATRIVAALLPLRRRLNLFFWLLLFWFVSFFPLGIAMDSMNINQPTRIAILVGLVAPVCILMLIGPRRTNAIAPVLLPRPAADIARSPFRPERIFVLIGVGFVAFSAFVIYQSWDDPTFAARLTIVGGYFLFLAFLSLLQRSPLLRPRPFHRRYRGGNFVALLRAFAHLTIVAALAVGSIFAFLRFAELSP